LAAATARRRLELRTNIGSRNANRARLCSSEDNVPRRQHR
jgi:hypothetical protein